MVLSGDQGKLFKGTRLIGGTLNKTAWEYAAAGHGGLLAAMQHTILEKVTGPAVTGHWRNYSDAEACH